MADERLNGDVDRRRFLRGAVSAGAATGVLGTYGADAMAQGSLAVDGLFDVRSYGATGDGVADDAPAVGAALDAAATAGGGTVLFPAGTYRLASPVARSFFNEASVIVLRGYGSASRIAVRAGPNAIALQLENLESVKLEDLVFVGTPGVATDAKVAVSFRYCIQALIQRCDFYGVSSVVEGGAVVRAENTDLRIGSSGFRGCGGNSGLATPVVDNRDWTGVTVVDTDFLDYGYLNGVFHSKTPIAAPEAWIRMGNVQSPKTVHEALVYIERVFMDEGATFGVACLPNASVSPKVDSIVISGARANVAGFDYTRGVILQWASNVRVEHSRFGYSTNQRPAVELRAVNAALIDSCICEAGANRIVADNEVTTLTVRETVYGKLDSSATQTEVIKGGRSSFLLRADAAIQADSLVVASKATAKRVVTAPLDAQASDVLGVALDAASTAGDQTRVVQVQGNRVTVRSDGSAAISVGDAVQPSPTMPGRVRPVVGGPSIGRAVTGGPASTSVSVDVVLLPGAAQASGFTAPALQRGWQSYGAGWEPGFYIDATRHVHLVGAIQGGMPEAGTLLFSLPRELWPERNAIFPVATDKGAATVLVRNDGAVVARVGVSDVYTGLDGIVFRARR